MSKVFPKKKTVTAFVIPLLLLVSAGCAAPATNITPPRSSTANRGAGTDALVISHNVPAFASSGNANDANNGDYNNPWWSTSTQAWLAYDLSRVPPARRSTVLLVWYNPSYNYDNTVIQADAYNVPENYTLDVNPAPGGGNPPSSGWETRVRVTDNHYHSRQHVLDMSGENWVRINVTTVDGSFENYNVRIKMDVYDTTYALANDWIFYGDSITAESMVNYSIGGEPGFAQLIHNQIPSQFPVQEDGGIGFLTSADGAKYLPIWLPIFPGRYVALSYGTNDALGCANPQSFRSNYVAMIQDVTKAGKVPVIPLIPWGRNPNLQSCVPLLNAEIEALYTAFPQVVRGPDLWSYFKSHQSLISSDNIHPTDAGTAAYRQQWVDTILPEVYAHQ